MSQQATVLFVIVVILLGIAGPIAERFIPSPTNPGVHRGAGPDEGVLPFQ
jgi:hypothetical protein